jgi:oxalate decarboxylase/phosphoglucose isomerase-like protein (cupin superfamily)
MTLKPGKASDEEVTNEHPRSEQWLFVVSGIGSATVISVGGRCRMLKLKTGTVVAIEKGESHQICNAGRKPLRTINFYCPPAYTSDGDVKNSAKT